MSDFPRHARDYINHKNKAVKAFFCANRGACLWGRAASAQKDAITKENMTCFKPINAWMLNSHPLDANENWLMYRQIYQNEKGEWKCQNKLNKIRFTEPSKRAEERYQKLQLPCGKCQGCRLDRANEWATRAWMESKNWTKNCFITLTYSDVHIPKNRSLRKKDLQDFWKRLRYYEKGKDYWDNPRTGKHENPIRYFACGEYGGKTQRPHYHAGVFNWEPDDLKKYKKNHTEDWLYTSKKLTKAWKKGHVIVGKMTYETSCYIARYVSKKVFGDNAESWYKGREPEFIETSRNGGIGIKNWEENKEKIKETKGIMIKIKDKVKIKKIPKYYKKIWKEKNIEEYAKYAFSESEKAKEIEKEILKNTNLTKKEYQKMQEEKLHEKLKKLKRNNHI